MNINKVSKNPCPSGTSAKAGLKDGLSLVDSVGKPEANGSGTKGKNQVPMGPAKHGKFQ